MNESSEQSEGNSLETRISVHKYFNNAGDGPQMPFRYCDPNQLSLHELTSLDKKIQRVRNIASDEYIENITISDKLNNSLHQIQKEKSNLGSFLEVGSGKIDIREVFKSIEHSITRFKDENSSLKHQISKDSEHLGSFLLKKDFTQSVHSKPQICNSNSAEMQKLQMFLLYILEQSTHLNGTLCDAQCQIEKVNRLKVTDLTEDKDKTSQDEDDVFSVEELSWDENQSLLEKGKNERRVWIKDEQYPVTKEESRDRHPSPRISSAQFAANSPLDNSVHQANGCVKHTELSHENSFKDQHSNSVAQQSNNNDCKPEGQNHVELSNSFYEIKRKFENLNFSNGITHSIKKDGSLLSYSDKKDSSGKESYIIENSKRSSIVKDISQIKHIDSLDDCVDNSAFLVSSIDSFTNSISAKNPDNNNNKFSDKFKTVNSYPIDTKKKSPSIAVDVIPGTWNAMNRSLLLNSTNMVHSRLPQRYLNGIGISNMDDLGRSELNIRKNPAGGTSFNNVLKNEADSKSSTSSSERIMALGKQPGRSKKVDDGLHLTVENSSSVHQCLKDLIDSENTYIKGLFILSNVLYSRIKASNFISMRHLKALFPDCIHQIYKVHTRFGDQLNVHFQQLLNLEILKNSDKHIPEDNMYKNASFGQIFLGILEKDNWKIFVLYKEYFLRSKLAFSTFDKLKNQSPKFDRLVKNLQHNEHCKGLDLGSFIFLPLQRLPMYLLLMRKILQKLPCAKTEDRVSILAVEHLIRNFLSEMEAKQGSQSSNKDVTGNEYSICHSSNSSTKMNLLNDISNHEVSESRNKDQSMSRQLSNKNSKAFLTQDQLTNNVLNDKNVINFGSNSREVCSAKEDLRTQDLLWQRHSTHSLENISFHTFESKEVNNNKEYCSINKKRYLPHSLNNITNVPRSDNYSSKSEMAKSTSLNGINDFDTESLKSQLTEECSVCLTSQEEFEIDTSFEDDDKTCTLVAKSDAVNQRDNCSSNGHQESLFSQNTSKGALIELNPNSAKKPQTFGLPSINNVNKPHLLSLEHKRILASTVLSNEVDLMIIKKVDNIVALLSNVLMEIFFAESEQKRNDEKGTFLIKSRPNFVPKQMKDQRNEFLDCPTETSLKSSEDVCGVDKISLKKFSLKHLFSLRRKSRGDPKNINTSPVPVADIATPARPFSRISFQKRGLKRDP